MYKNRLPGYHLLFWHKELDIKKPGTIIINYLVLGINHCSYAVHNIPNLTVHHLLRLYLYAGPSLASLEKRLHQQPLSES